MSRLPPIAPNDLTGDRKQAYDDISATAASVFKDKFVYKRDDGAFVGPFAPFIYTPPAGRAFFEVMKALAKIPGLPIEAREVAILATGSKWHAAFEIYSHERIAAGTKLTEAHINEVKNGRKPDDLDEGCSVAFDVAMELLNKMGPLSEEKWAAAEKLFGKEGAAALVHYVGFYTYTCILLNGFNIPLPEGESIK